MVSKNEHNLINNIFPNVIIITILILTTLPVTTPVPLTDNNRTLSTEIQDIQDSIFNTTDSLENIAQQNVYNSTPEESLFTVFPSFQINSTQSSSKWGVSATSNNTVTTSKNSHNTTTPRVNLAMQLNNDGHSVLVSWTTAVFNNSHHIQGFMVSYRMDGRENYDSSRLGHEVRTFFLHSLHEDNEYTICVQAVGQQDISLDETCMDWSKASMKMVIGIIAGTIFLFPCFLVMMWVIFKDCRMKDKGLIKSPDNNEKNVEECCKEAPTISKQDDPSPGRRIENPHHEEMKKVNHDKAGWLEKKEGNDEVGKTDEKENDDKTEKSEEILYQDEAVESEKKIYHGEMGKAEEKGIICKIMKSEETVNNGRVVKVDGEVNHKSVVKSEKETNDKAKILENNKNHAKEVKLDTEIPHSENEKVVDGTKDSNNKLVNYSNKRIVEEERLNHFHEHNSIPMVSKGEVMKEEEEKEGGVERNEQTMNTEGMESHAKNSNSIPSDQETADPIKPETLEARFKTCHTSDNSASDGLQSEHHVNIYKNKADILSNNTSGTLNQAFEPDDNIPMYFYST